MTTAIARSNQKEAGGKDYQVSVVGRLSGADGAYFLLYAPDSWGAQQYRVLTKELINYA